MYFKLGADLKGRPQFLGVEGVPNCRRLPTRGGEGSKKCRRLHFFKNNQNQKLKEYYDLWF